MVILLPLLVNNEQAGKTCLSEHSNYLTQRKRRRKIIFTVAGEEKVLSIYVAHATFFLLKLPNYGLLALVGQP
jgi:hypothetical protein